MKKLIYIANIRLPTEKAHGIQIMEMCAAFAHQGLEVELAVPYRHNHIKDETFSYYNMKQTFKIIQVRSFDLVSLGKIGFLVQTLTFLISALPRVFFVNKKRNETIFYTREAIVAYMLSSFGLNVTWETHMGHDNFFIRALIRRNVPIVAITGGLRDLYVSWGAKNISVAPDGVDIKQFQIPETRLEARKKLGLPMEKKIVMYTGHLYSWKGADVLAEAAESLGDDVLVIFVGGTEKDVASFKDKFGQKKNIMILGNKPHHEIPLYLRAADVLVIPNSAKEKISRLYTSPMKLFEYMASGTPIVATRLPSLLEILSEKNSILVNPDNPEDIARGINSIFADIQHSTALSERSLADVQQYSWEKRAKNILNFIKGKA